MRAVETRVRQFYEFGPFRLAPGEHRLYRQGEIVLLPPKEFDLLLLLVKNSEQVMDRERLIKALWPNTVVEEANLNVHISALRKALSESPGEQRYIETLPRLGYRFIAPVKEVLETENAGPTPTLPLALNEEKNTDQDLSFVTRQAVNGGSDWYTRHRLAAITLPLWLLVIAFLGILAFLFFKSLWVSPTGSANNPAINVIPLTIYAGRELQPAFSPDGNQIAFVWSGEKNSNAEKDIHQDVDGYGWRDIFRRRRVPLQLGHQVLQFCQWKRENGC